jgi:hypothetical protein
MMSTDAPVTACGLVFGGPANAAAALAQAVAPDRVSGKQGLRRLSAATRDAAVRDVSGVGAELLDLDLGGLLVMGWRTYATLIQAARRTAAAPGREEIVDIVTHRIGATYHPSVEVLVDEVRVTAVGFALTLEFEVKALSAVIRAGQIVALESGRCATRATIAIEGVPVATRTAEHDLHVLIHVGDGIPLLPAQNPPPAPFPTAPQQSW